MSSATPIAINDERNKPHIMSRQFVLSLLCFVVVLESSIGFVIRPPTSSSTTWAIQQHQLSLQQSLQERNGHPLYRPSISNLLSRSRANYDEATAPGKPSRRQRWRKRLVRFGQTLILASAFASFTPKAAHAKFSHELQEERTLSLRPGLSQEQATALAEEGEVPDDLPKATSTITTQQQSRNTADKQAPTKLKEAAKKNSFDYGDEDDDDFEDDDLFMDEKAKDTSGRRTSISKSAMAKSADFQAATKSQFSGMGPKSKSQSKMMTVKVSVGLFIPTWGAMGVREFVRRRKEETYVQKGLAILEAQKAEYFNITETKSDSEIEDELKDLKDSEDDDDEDDEDDEEDDDDDEEDDEEDDEPPSRRRPKRPSGGGGDNGGGADDGSGRPSDDDLKRLGDIFDKS